MKLDSVSGVNHNTTLKNAQQSPRIEKGNLTPPVALSFLSKQDTAWDKNRSYSEDVANIYTGTGQHTFDRLAQRIDDCSQFLTFNWQDNTETGETALKLANTQFCRVRHCPVCQWRRSLMWKARFYDALPALQEKYPTHRFIFLTLTVKNVEIMGLRAQLQEMNKAWRKLVQRKQFKASVAGFVRTTEVTRNRKTDAAHPHYHALLVVEPSYFGKKYINQKDWVAMWQSCLNVDYTPVVDVRAVKSKAGSDKEALASAVAETLKYAVKPSDLVNNGPWLLELTKQVHKLRFIASGGLLKDALKEDEESNEDLIKTGLEEEEAQAEEEPDQIVFNWFPSQRKYLKYK